ncbi:MAG: O-methyltransferase [Clostridia bacterium]|nr:O-methyltransferase [Clostridia bacterium]
MNNEINEILKFGRELGYPLMLDDSVKLLIETVQNLKPNKVLEIGTAIGYSGSLILSSCDCNLITLEKNSDSAEIAKSNFAKLGLSDRVQVINVDAMDYLINCNDKFSFIFLDGPKGQYLHYKDKLIDLLEVGGILLADNVLFRNYVRGNEEVPRKFKTLVNNLRLFLNQIENDKRLQTTIYNIGDGVSISKKLCD